MKYDNWLEVMSLILKRIEEKQKQLEELLN